MNDLNRQAFFRSIVTSLILAVSKIAVASAEMTYDRSFEPYDYDRRYICDYKTVELFGDYSMLETSSHKGVGSFEILFSAFKQALLVINDPQASVLSPIFFDIKTDNETVLWLWPVHTAKFETNRYFHVKFFKDRQRRNLLWIIKVNDADVFISYTCKLKGGRN